MESVLNRVSSFLNTFNSSYDSVNDSSVASGLFSNNFFSNDYFFFCGFSFSLFVATSYHAGSSGENE